MEAAVGQTINWIALGSLCLGVIVAIIRGSMQLGKVESKVEDTCKDITELKMLTKEHPTRLVKLELQAEQSSRTLESLKDRTHDIANDVNAVKMAQAGQTKDIAIITDWVKEQRTAGKGKNV